MWKIALLDDDVSFAHTTKQMVYEYFDQRKQEIRTFDLFTQGNDLLESSKHYDILFLDIEVGEENGIAIAKELRKKLPDLLIVVMTSYLKYSMEGYKIQAARYLLKPVPKALLFSELDEVLSLVTPDEFVLIENKQTLYRIRIQDIYYMESYGRKSKLYTKSEEFLSEEAISHWCKKLHEYGFMECYKGICVSLRHIKSIQKDTMTLENEKYLPLARRREEQVKHAWVIDQERRL